MLKETKRIVIVFAVAICLSFLTSCTKVQRAMPLIPKSCVQCVKDVSVETFKLICTYLSGKVPILDCDKLVEDLRLEVEKE